MSKTQKFSYNLRWACHAGRTVLMKYLETVTDVRYHRYGCSKNNTTFIQISALAYGLLIYYTMGSFLDPMLVVKDLVAKKWLNIFLGKRFLSKATDRTRAENKASCVWYAWATAILSEELINGLLLKPEDLLSIRPKDGLIMRCDLSLPHVRSLAPGKNHQELWWSFASKTYRFYFS